MDQVNENSKPLSGWVEAISAGITAAVVVPVVFVVTFPLTLYEAWVLRLMWEWFIVPVFNLRPLNLGYAFGLLLTLWFLSAQTSKNKTELANDTPSAIIQLFIVGVIGPTCSLGAGWLVKTFFCS